MRLTTITIRSLFGVYNYDIKLRSKDRISIIHGPNGCGKTSVLRFLADLSALEFESFWGTPFSLFSVEFDNGIVISVSKHEAPPRRRSDLRARSSSRLKVSRKAPGKRLQSVILTAPGGRMDSRFDYAIERYMPWIRRHSFTTWIDTRDGEVMDAERVSRLLSRVAGEPVSARVFGNRGRSYPKWLNDAVSNFGVHFIETQRLVTLSRSSDEPGGASSSIAVARYSQELADAIKVTLARSAEISQSLDRTLPSRLLQGERQRLPVTALQRKYKAQTEKRRRLIDAGLLEAEEDVALPSRKLNEVERRVLAHYLTDVDKRLKVFDSLLLKIELFKTMINKRFRHKKMSIQKGSGMVFSMEDSGQIIPPTALSSGEQHELVLAYQLIFKVRPETLILIDEPELSLHVTWQHEFLTDVKRVSEVADLDFLIATHSPQIVHKRWDLAIALDGGAR